MTRTDYVRPETTTYQISWTIRDIERELRENRLLTAEDRAALHEQLDYLRSFLPVETF